MLVVLVEAVLSHVLRLCPVFAFPFVIGNGLRGSRLRLRRDGLQPLTVVYL